MTLHRLPSILVLILALILTACGSQSTPTTSPSAQPDTAVLPAAPADAATPEVEAPAEPAEAAACEDYFGFCITAETAGAVNAAGVGGWASSSNTDCTAWAAAGAARILELPNLLPAGEQKINVALTRIGAYTGPGTYSLAATATGGAMPDQFPAVQVDGRAFNNGEGSAATVTINADGSGSLTAGGLVEIDAMQGNTPDPNARLDFAMQWTCRGK